MYLYDFLVDVNKDRYKTFGLQLYRMSSRCMSYLLKTRRSFLGSVCLTKQAKRAKDIRESQEMVERLLREI